MIRRRLLNSVAVLALTASACAGVRKERACVCEAHGFPPPVTINGFVLEGSHLPVEFRVKYDSSTRTALECDERGSRLDPAVRTWYVETATKDCECVDGVEWLAIRANDRGDIELRGAQSR